ncbi:MAG: DNA-directed RNA polymerase subunit omega [Firmicutes bacterium]|nr:DNA-directed RNA polymerase subunit omega [Bacillota bacterium]
MIQPPIDKLISKAGCRYVLANVVAKRVRVLIGKNLRLEKQQNIVEHVSLEIFNDKLKIVKE